MPAPSSDDPVSAVAELVRRITVLVEDTPEDTKRAGLPLSLSVA
jgi:hypothetical protein